MVSANASSVIGSARQVECRRTGRTPSPETIGRGLNHNMLRQHLAFILGEDSRAFYDVAQLAHIARPIVLQQLKRGFRAQASTGAN